MNKHLFVSIALLLVALCTHAQTNTFPSSGNVGIGTTSPQQRLHVEGTSNQAIFVSTSAPSTTSGSGMIGYAKATPTASGQRLGYFLVGSRGGAQNGYNVAGLVGYAGGAWSSTSRPAYLSFETTPSGATARVERLRIDQNGHLLPGTTNAYDVGTSSLAFRNLYLRGEVYLDGTRFLSNAASASSLSTFVGSNSGLAITTGLYNTALGHDALRNTNTGSQNVAVGTQALFTNSGGINNIAVGVNSLYKSNGSNNTALGNHAMYGSQYGNNNTAVGEVALYGNFSGSNNTAVGYSAGYDVVNEDGFTLYTLPSVNSTFLGANTNHGNYAADPSNFPAVYNATAVGYEAVAVNNSVHLGNHQVTSIGGQVNWTTYSDGRYKQNIKEDVQGLDFINALRPITYTVDVKGLNARQNKARKGGGEIATDATVRALAKASEAVASQVIYSGFVAQEVEAAAKKLKYEFSGVDKPKNQDGLYGLRYSDFVVPLVKAVQELDAKSKRIEVLEKKNTDLEARLAKLEALLTKSSNNTTANLSSAYLEQASPNPAQGTTTIRYGIPDGVASARLTLTNSKGQLLKTIGLTGRGTGQVNLETTPLPAGSYTYTLYVDGRQATSKQLVIIK